MIKAMLNVCFSSLPTYIDQYFALQGDFDTGKKQIVSVGIPGFSIPPIFKLGPWFELDGQIKGKIDLNIDIDVGANYGGRMFPDLAATRYELMYHGLPSTWG